MRGLVPPLPAELSALESRKRHEMEDPSIR